MYTWINQEKRKKIKEKMIKLALSAEPKVLSYLSCYYYTIVTIKLQVLYLKFFKNFFHIILLFCKKYPCAQHWLKKQSVFLFCQNAEAHR